MFYGKKAYLSFQRKRASDMCNSMHCAIFSYFYWKKDKTHIFFFVGWYLLDSFLSGERDLECLRVWKHENNNKVMGFKDELKLRLLDVLLEFSFLLR